MAATPTTQLTEGRHNINGDVNIKKKEEKEREREREREKEWSRSTKKGSKYVDIASLRRSTRPESVLDCCLIGHNAICGLIDQLLGLNQGPLPPSILSERLHSEYHQSIFRACDGWKWSRDGSRDHQFDSGRVSCVAVADFARGATAPN